jgi:SAM-dependent methyltransferase/acyl-coenzyme A thioesterase PaaI-like protein
MDAFTESQERRRHFAERSRHYAERGYDREEAARFVASVLGPTKDAVVLDVGTGKGLLAVALAARGVAVVTVDPDATDRDLVVELAREGQVLDRVEVLTGDAASLGYPDGYFTAAAAMDVLHHLADPEPVLKEMVRTLSPHGELLLADFSREGFDLVSRVHREEGRVHPESGVTLDDAAALLRGWGLCPVLRLTRHLHEIAVFNRCNHAHGEDTLRDMRRLSHPHCVVCGSDSPNGLRLSFSVQPDRSVHSRFDGGAAYQGYPDAIHGGLVATLLDAAMTNCLFALGITAVTARLNVRYVAPALWYRPCDVSGRLLRSARGVRYLASEVRQDGRVVAEATGTFRDRPGTVVPGGRPDGQVVR